jgi:hypothetical protein
MSDQQAEGVIMIDEAPGLTDWDNPPKVSDLKQDYTDAKGDHDEHLADVQRWMDNLYVRGSAKIKKKANRSTIVPKLIRKQAEWRYAALSEPFLSNPDLFQTEPMTWADTEAAEQNGLILNNQFNTQLNKVNFIDEYVRAAVDEGTVIIRVGWDFLEEEAEVPNKIPQPIEDPDMIQQIMEGAQMLMENPGLESNVDPDMLADIEVSMEAGVPLQLVVDPKNPTKMEMQTIRNQPTLDICDHESVILDPSCKGNIDKANFIIYSFETSLSDLKKEGDLYSNLEYINTESNAIQSSEDRSDEASAFNFKDEPRKKFMAYEYWGYWDIHDTGMTKPIVATWVGDTIIRMEESPFADRGLPFVLVQYLPKRKKIYGEPDGELLEDNQLINGAVTRGMIDIMGRSAAGQIGMRADALDITNQRRFEAGKDYYFNANIDPRAAVHTHVYPEIPNSAQYMVSMVHNDAESLSGVKSFSSSGISGEGLGRSATAARSALDAASKRELGILRRLAKGIIDIGRKIIAMNATMLSDKEVVRVTDDRFVTVKRDDLEGRIDVKLSISTAETDNAKAEELSFMLQTMGNNMPQEMSQMVLVDIAKLRKMPELAKRLEEYKPEPDPIAVEMQQLELEKLRAEVDKIRSEAVENLAGAEADEAKARLSDAQADRTDLEYVEQQTGTTQERDLQKAGAQADGNMRLEVVKAALNPKGGNTANKAETP